MKMVMVDLETMSVNKNAAILSIGAVVFDQYNVFNDKFYVNVDLDSCLKLGLCVDATTQEFWSRKENEGAYSQLTIGAVPVDCALKLFRSWLLQDANPDDLEMWCNGTSFDLAILEVAYSFARLPLPWRFYHERDYRTMKNMFKVEKPEFEGTKHNAVHDARHQAQHLVRIFDAIRKPEEQR